MDKYRDNYTPTHQEISNAAYKIVQSLQALKNSNQLDEICIALKEGSNNEDISAALVVGLRKIADEGRLIGHGNIKRFAHALMHHGKPTDAMRAVARALCCVYENKIYADSLDVPITSCMEKRYDRDSIINLLKAFDEAYSGAQHDRPPLVLLLSDMMDFALKFEQLPLRQR